MLDSPPRLGLAGTIRSGVVVHKSVVAKGRHRNVQ